jgi:lauroyl/myristoyl acyltransferase
MQDIFHPADSKYFQLLFLARNRNKSVEVVETEEIDLREILEHLRRGESVFITHKFSRDENGTSEPKKKPNTSWYFTHL